MLIFLENHKKYIWWMVTVVLFGIVGLLMVPIVKYAVKLVNRYPNLLKWFLVIVCICSLFIENWDARTAIICIGVALTSNILFADNR